MTYSQFLQNSTKFDVGCKRDIVPLSHKYKFCPRPHCIKLNIDGNYHGNLDSDWLLSPVTMVVAIDGKVYGKFYATGGQKGLKSNSIEYCSRIIVVHVRNTQGPWGQAKTKQQISVSLELMVNKYPNLKKKT